jgi:phosphomannomutase
VARDLITVDGTKWVFDDRTWVLLRLSGTEPVARLYVETDRTDRLEELTEAFSTWISGRQEQ